jgi:hypothetical protein
VITSPDSSRRGRATRSPLTNVPWRLSRSVTRTPSATAVMTAWRRETWASASRIVHSGSRPSVSSPSPGSGTVCELPSSMHNR